MRIAALDISKNRIGVAISDDDGIFISFDTLINARKKNFKMQLENIYKKYKPNITYIGLPMGIMGNMNDNMRFIKTLTHNMRNIIGKFKFLDERMTTQLAQRIALENNEIKSLDQIAARMLCLVAISNFHNK